MAHIESQKAQPVYNDCLIETGFEPEKIIQPAKFSAIKTLRAIANYVRLLQ